MAEELVHRKFRLELPRRHVDERTPAGTGCMQCLGQIRLACSGCALEHDRIGGRKGADSVQHLRHDCGPCDRMGQQGPARYRAPGALGLRDRKSWLERRSTHGRRHEGNARLLGIRRAAMHE